MVDLFAGPGGLGEGFASCAGENDKSRFHSLVSIECDLFSHRTLLLRHFFRLFPSGEIPESYYDYLRGSIGIEDLYRQYNTQYHEASKSALQIALGKETHNYVQRIINKRLAGRRKWVLVGGPPCQAYSLVGRSRMMGDPDFESDERHFLYREYLKIIIDYRPPIFVMENVKGLLSARIKGQPVIQRIVSDLTTPKAALGNDTNGLAYRLYSLAEDELPDEGIDPRLFLVKAEEFGVPQARHRMFIVGVRSDINVRPRRLRRHKAPTVEDTIGHLPAVRSGLSRGEDSPEAWRREIVALATTGNLRGQLNGAEHADAIINRIRRLHTSVHDYPIERSSARYPEQTTKPNRVLTFMCDSRLCSLNAHEARSHMASDLRRYMYAAVFAEVTKHSPKLSDFPVSLLPDHRNVALGTSGKMFSDRFRVQLSHEVATTITSHISKDGHYFIHYDPLQCRSLTVREAARLQTFPDNYKFEGPRTQQYHQIGNAVPPYLAAQIAEIIADVLDSMKDN
ncbi:DNA cytosine methyltransferase [Nitrosomonas europaea]|uniref:DNA cytosine methyltransferase n=1 Tax=Nitrosomonas europaea TaxID=915 RepID=UPI003267C834